MIRNRFHLCLALAALVALPVAAETPDWPNNGWRYSCDYTLADGASGQAIVELRQIWSSSHVFPDGNELRRGRMITEIGGVVTGNEPVDIVWKPVELPSPPGATRFELTIPQTGVQCKNFVNDEDAFYGPKYTFSQCSNGTVMSCTFCGASGFGC